MKMLISVIVPIYNVASYLERCIDSICKQTYKDLQIILVDDGSQDQSGTICDKYKELDSRCEVIHKGNGGLVSARKAGLKLARGQYVLNVDADDWIEEEAVEKLVDLANINDADIVCAAHYCDYGATTKKMFNKLQSGSYESYSDKAGLLSKSGIYQFQVTPYLWSKLIRKSILEKTQFDVDERISLGEDVAVVFPALLQARRFYVTDYAAYHYVQRIGSITYKIHSDELQKDTWLIRCLYQSILSQKDVELLTQQLNQYAKLILLTRKIDWFDRNEFSRILIPFGGIVPKGKAIVYAAGKFGESIYRYLMGISSIQVFAWVDQNYSMYQELGLPVNKPTSELLRNPEVDYIFIGVTDGSISASIKDELCELGIDSNKIYTLDKNFVSDENNVLDKILA